MYIKENLQMALGLMDVLGEQLLVGASPRQWVQYLGPDHGHGVGK